MLRWLVGICLPVLLLSLCAGSAIAAPLPVRPAVLCIGNGGPTWPLAKKLRAEFGINVGICDFGALKWETLTRFNAVILFDMSRLNPDTRDEDAVEISPAGFQRVSELLTRFVQEGGGLYIYGVSFTHMGQGWAGESLNKFLQPFGAQIPFEMLRDELKEKRQESGQKVLYALADGIVAHPATAGVKNLWYAIGPFSYGPWTRPLKLGKEWTPLIRTSPAFKATPIDPDKGWNNPLAGATSAITDKQAIIYAVRSFGQGRIVLSGGESTISFFGYAYSEFADKSWGRIGMEAGLNGIPSDGLKLFVSSLQWVMEPSVTTANFGGYQPPPEKPFEPYIAPPMTWDEAKPVPHEFRYVKGVIGVMPAIGGGTGTVAEYVEQAKKQGLGYLVIAGNFRKMERPAWDQLVAECKAATTTDFVVVPSLITQDEQDNFFLQAGRLSWPKPERLSQKDPKRVHDHLGYWMSDCNFPFRAPFWLSHGQYPAWLQSGYNSFAVRTYENGKLVDENVPGFLQNQEQGDRSRLVTINLVSSPAQLSAVKDFTYIQAGNATQLEEAFTNAQFSGGSISYVSNGPRVQFWQVGNATRNTEGAFYVPGTERWRATLKVASDVPLKSVTIYDSTRVFRRYAVTGNTCDISFDGLHDTRRVLAAVVEDINGGRAMTGTLDTQDTLLYQFFCSDRCNIMSGGSKLRDAEGRVDNVAATSMLYKAGRLYTGTVTKGEGLPGIDGSGGGAQLSLYPDFFLTATDPAKSEERSPLHQINRPYESADCIIFDTPTPKRAKTPTTWIFGHAPYLDLADSKVDGRLVQYHFYRKPLYPSPVIADMSMKVTDPNGVQLKQGWNGFSARYSTAWSNALFKYAIIRADGTRIEGPSADEKTGTAWRGALHPGDLVLFPEHGEGMFVLDGDLDIVLECTPSKGWFRLYTGRFDTPQLTSGTVLSTRVAILKTKSSTGEGAVAECLKFRDSFGIGGKSPAYTVTATQGKVTATRYLLELAAERHGFQGTISKAALPQRLPVKVTGLNEKWTAARVDIAKKQWFPLGVWQGAAYLSLDTTEGDQQLYIGNLVTADNPDVFLTLLPANADGKVYVEVHNPTEKAVPVTVTVPVTTFLASKQNVQVTVEGGCSKRVELQ
ncbi:MAG: hypothetical protein ACYC7E_00150 [Armatimonadota bacterium]